MVHLKKNAAGKLTRAINGHLAECPGGIICAFPTIFLTVTGASGTANWVGETWVLPGDSGDRKEVCPDSYTLARGYTAPIYYVMYGYKYARETWIKGAGANAVVMIRGFNFDVNDGATNYVINGVNDMQVIIENNLLGSAAQDHLQLTYVTGYPFAYNWINSNTLYTSIGLIAFADSATYSDYRVKNSWFGNYTRAGITYTWERGNGW